MENVKEAVKGLMQSEFDQFLSWMLVDERKRRETEEATEQALMEAFDQAIETGQMQDIEAVTMEQAEESPDAIPEWVNPGTIHSKMYRLGQVVRHNGRIWISNYNGLNSWEPGGVGVYDFVWEDITAEVEPPVETPEPEETESEGEPIPFFVQPTGGHDAYKIGDKVSYNDAVWESVIDNNVWSPDDYPAGWTKL